MASCAGCLQVIQGAFVLGKVLILREAGFVLGYPIHLLGLGVNRYGFHLVRFGDWFSASFGLICFFIYCYSVHPCHVKLIEFRF